MSDFNIVDGVILAIVIVSSLLAYSRGLVRELMSIAAWIIAAFLAYFLAPEVLPFVHLDACFFFHSTFISGNKQNCSK